MSEEVNMPTANDLTPIDDAVVRNTAEEVIQTARKAHRIEVALVVIAAVMMVAIAGFTGWNTYRLRAVNQNLTFLLEVIRDDQHVQQTYNESHAKSTAASHRALAVNLQCLGNFFAAAAGIEGAAAPSQTDLDACFRPTEEAPPDAPLPQGRD